MTRDADQQYTSFHDANVRNWVRRFHTLLQFQMGIYFLSFRSFDDASSGGDYIVIPSLSELTI